MIFQNTEQKFMGRKEEYKTKNEQFLEELRAENDIKELPTGILYRVIEAG